MYNLYNSNVDCRVHQLGERESTALREVQMDRLAAIAESSSPQKPFFLTRISAYLRGKLHFHMQPSMNNPASHPTPSAAGVE